MNEAVPYGAGSIIYRKENTYSPYVARRYKGTNKNGNPSYLYLASCPTKEEARDVLIQNAFLSPRDLINEQLTFYEIFTSFINHHQEYSKDALRKYQYAYRRCKKIQDKKYQQITVSDMRTCINEADTHSMKSWIRRLFCAMDNEVAILGMNIRKESQFLEYIHRSTEDNQRRVIRTAFLEEEVQRFILHKDDPYMYIPLILCYTGLRNSELRFLKKEDIHLNDGYLIAGMKTEAGMNRMIPVHPMIYDVMEELMHTDSPYLIYAKEGRPIHEVILRRRFRQAIAPYVHRDYVPHEARHTFVTKLMNEGVSDNLIRKLAGHKIPDASYRFYYHPSLEQLKEAIMKLW